MEGILVFEIEVMFGLIIVNASLDWDELCSLQIFSVHQCYRSRVRVRDGRSFIYYGV